MKNSKFSSIIIAAGLSSRMGSFKPLLKFGDYTAIETIVNTHIDAGIDDIVVVVGYRGHEIEKVLKSSKVKCVYNENFSRGMFSSILKGLEAVDDSTQAFFMQPADIPLVKKRTLKTIMDKYSECRNGIIYPAFNGTKGHPPLIDCKYKNIILNSSGEGGLKKILDDFSGDSICVPVFDQAILIDMDAREDYKKLCRYYLKGAPNREECLSMLNIYDVPDNIVRHCCEVARVSAEILECLKDCSCSLNEPALEAAALLHDIARKDKNHAEKGGAILKEIGYGNVGRIIATHMDIEVTENTAITENEILYLADKLVKEDRVMSLNSRFKQQINAFKTNPEALAKIHARFEAARNIMTKVEKITGKGFIYG